MENTTILQGFNFSSTANISDSSQVFITKCYYFEEEYDPVPGFQLNFVLIGVVNILLAIVTSALNILTLIVIYKVKHLQTPSNLFISGLSITDTCTGMVIFPSHAAVNLMLSAHWMSCPLRLFLTFAGYFFGSCGLFCLILISTDRYLAVFHPYVYERLTLEHRRVIKLIAITWTISLILVILSFLTPRFILYIIFIVVILIILLIWSLYTQGKILKAAHKIIREINPVAQVGLRSYRVEGNKNKEGKTHDFFSFDNMKYEREEELDSAATDTSYCVNPKVVDKLSDNRNDFGTSCNSDNTSNVLKSNVASCFSQPTSSNSRLTTSCNVEDNTVPGPESGRAIKRWRKISKNIGSIFIARRKEAIRNATENFKAAKLTISIVAAQYILYIPHGILIALYFMMPVTTRLHVAHGWTATLSLSNSTVNPIIYCWQLKGFMTEAKALLLNRRG